MIGGWRIKRMAHRWMGARTHALNTTLGIHLMSDIFLSSIIDVFKIALKNVNKICINCVR